MAFDLIIEPEAELDLEQAVTWYDNQRLGLGKEFLEQVEKVFHRIRETPEIYSVVHRTARLALVRRFP